LADVRVFVVALAGSGKTTIMKKLGEILPGVRVVTFGDFMFDEAKALLGVTHRDEMRSMLTLEDYRMLQVSAAKRIAELNGTLIIDTHSVIQSNRGFYPGLPSEVVRIIRPDAVVHLEFRPEDILSRRAKDAGAGEGSRRRPVETPDAVERDQTTSRQFAVSAANEAMCYLKILRYDYEQRYPYQHADEAARDIAEVIKSLGHPQPSSRSFRR